MKTKEEEAIIVTGVGEALSRGQMRRFADCTLIIAAIALIQPDQQNARIELGEPGQPATRPL